MRGFGISCGAQALSLVMPIPRTERNRSPLIECGDLIPGIDRMQAVARKLSPQNDNVLFAQSRNVLLTPSSWGGGRRTTTNDASRTGPPSLDFSSNLPVERRGECQMSDNKGVSHGEVLMEENTLCCGHSRRAKSLGLLRLLGPTR